MALRVIPLQLASWLIVPLPWTLPRMVVLQMAQPLAVVEGTGKDDALTASREMMTPVVWQYAGGPDTHNPFWLCDYDVLQCRTWGPSCCSKPWSRCGSCSLT